VHPLAGQWLREAVTTVGVRVEVWAGLEPAHPTGIAGAHIGTAAPTAGVARAASAEVELPWPRSSTSPADLDGARCLDIVKTPHLGCPVMPAQPAGKRHAHGPSVNDPWQPNHEQGQDNMPEPNAQSMIGNRQLPLRAPRQVSSLHTLSNDRSASQPMVSAGSQRAGPTRGS
jgi:hypothetical protein